jgi:hypothetical protein
LSADETLEEEGAPRKSAALALAAQGFHVFAVDPRSKRPDKLLAPAGFKNATTTADTIAGWFDVKPKCNVGIACGAEYGIVVFDVDTKNGARGLETLKNLWIDVPTLTANTPSGGLHLYFKHPGVALVAKLDGIDIKGADGGGYVLAPPSELSNGAYSWRDNEIPVAAFPSFLLKELRADKVRQKNGEKPATGPVASIKVPQGKRHDRLNDLGAIYRGKGLNAEEIEALLWWHATENCTPPFSHDSPEDVREIEALTRYWKGKDANGVTPAAESRSLIVLTSSELFARADAIPDRLLLDPPLPEAGNLMIYGPTGAGKSHLALVIALALARGSSVLNWLAPQAVPVLFCDGEMPLPELKARLQQYLGGAAPPDTFFWAAARAQEVDMPDLSDPAAQARYLEAIEACGAKVVVFDNLTCLRQTHADNPENSIEAWHPIAAFIRRLNGLGVAVIIVHHSAKSGTQRGSSAHTAVMDTVLRIVAPGEGQADPRAELDVEVHFEKHRRFNGEATLALRAKVMADANGYATWTLTGPDPLADDVARLVLAGHTTREIEQLVNRNKSAVQKARKRAQARGLLPLGGKT